MKIKTTLKTSDLAINKKVFIPQFHSLTCYHFQSLYRISLNTIYVKNLFIVDISLLYSIIVDIHTILINIHNNFGQEKVLK